MIIENSGKIFKFSLDHNLGYSYAEILDFTDITEFDGRIIYVFDLEGKDVENIDEIISSKLLLGPILLYKFPNAKGKFSWKLIGRTEKFITTRWPLFKKLQGSIIKDYNWNNLEKWYIVDRNSEDNSINYFLYDEIRYVETTILNSHVGVAKKATMMHLIKENKKVSDYYDLSEIGNRNLFIQLVNTYYPLERTVELLKEIESPLVGE
ncbi:MAG: hypothetical protein R2728_15440 [Chitinophagales bacterium]